MVKKKRTIITLSILIASLAYLKYDYPYNPNYIIEDSIDGPFAKYSKGDIYIGDSKYIKKLKDKVNEDDILIELGYKYTNDEIDPNAKIISSYRITDKNDRYSILQALKIYSLLYPSDWNRDIDSMRVEWSVHNILYNLNYDRPRTKDVDLDNDDEKIYSNKILKRIIK